MNYSVTRTDLEKDGNDILLLWRRNFPNLPRQRYDWIYRQNPHGKALSWVAREAGSGSLVGAASLFPRRMNLNGRTVTVGIAGDFAVDQEHRGSNVAIKLQRAVAAGMAESDLGLIYGISNNKSEPVQRRVGYVLLGRMNRWAKPLTTARYFKAAPLCRWMSKPLNFIMRNLSKEARCRRATGYVTQELDSFDQRFDRLWERASGQFHIIGQRSEDYLNWRYGSSPHRSYHVFSLIREDNQEISGYVVYYLQDRVSYIADLLFLDFGSSLDDLLSSFILHLRDQDVESLSVLLFGCPPLAKKLKGFGFVLRDEESRVLVYLDSNSPQTEFALNPENWFLLEGDRDI